MQNHELAKEIAELFYKLAHEEDLSEEIKEVLLEFWRNHS